MAASKLGAAVDLEEEESEESEVRVEDPAVPVAVAAEGPLYYVHQKDWKYHAKGKQREKSWMEDSEGFEKMLSNMRWAYNKAAEENKAKEAQEAKEAKEAKDPSKKGKKKKNKGINRRLRGVQRGFTKGPGTIRAVPSEPKPPIQPKPLKPPISKGIPRAFQDKTPIKAESVGKALIPRTYPKVIQPPVPAININFFGSSGASDVIAGLLAAIGAGMAGQPPMPPPAAGPGPIIEEVKPEEEPGMDVDDEDEEDGKGDSEEGKNKRKRDEE
ncbi:unnamed protein product [Symbiodinium sp. CCMP2592]|nr:unnamed protein product [Symbiodinium sp. CCMP2592]